MSAFRRKRSNARANKNLPLPRQQTREAGGWRTRNIAKVEVATRVSPSQAPLSRASRRTQRPRGKRGHPHAHPGMFHVKHSAPRNLARSEPLRPPRTDYARIACVHAACAGTACAGAARAERTCAARTRAFRTRVQAGTPALAHQRAAKTDGPRSAPSV